MERDALKIVEDIHIIQKCFSGPECPLCGHRTQYLSTNNQWRYRCVSCDKRLNNDLEIMPEISDPAWRP